MTEFFQPLRAALNGYDIALDQNGRREEYAKALDECHARVLQLEYLLSAVRARVEERFRITERPIKEARILADFARALGEEPLLPPRYDQAWSEQELRRRSELAFEAEMFTESFYWIAWRVRQVIRTLPELGSFDAEGIRNTRNHLIEHPERHLAATPVRDLRLSRDQGVTLLRWTGAKDDVEIDDGLIADATEFHDRLTAALERAAARFVS